MTKKTILITGATGFVGSKLAETLIESDYQIKVFVRNQDKLSKTIRNKCQVVVGDISEFNDVLSAVSGVDIIINCAANVSTWDNWDAYYKVNVLGVENLVKAVKQNNPNISRILHVSTVDVYGFPDAPCDENSQIKIEGNYGYGKSKAMGEILLRKYCNENDIAYTVFRPTNIIGPNGQFVQRIGMELKSGLMLKINGGSLNCGFLYIDNLLSYMLWEIENNQAINKCYNICDNNNVCWNEFIKVFKNKISGRGVVLNLPYKLAYLAAFIVENTYKILRIKKEPILHRLLVDMFGKTCGHNANKIREESKIKNLVNFSEAMNVSTEWFLKNNS